MGMIGNYVQKRRFKRRHNALQRALHSTKLLRRDLKIALKKVQDSHLCVYNKELKHIEEHLIHMKEHARAHKANQHQKH